MKFFLDAIANGFGCPDAIQTLGLVILQNRSLVHVPPETNRFAERSSTSRFRAPVFIQAALLSRIVGWALRPRFGFQSGVQFPAQLKNPSGVVLLRQLTGNHFPWAGASVVVGRHETRPPPRTHSIVPQNAKGELR